MCGYGYGDCKDWGFDALCSVFNVNWKLKRCGLIHDFNTLTSTN